MKIWMHTAKMNNVVFLTGAPRSGTSLAVELLGQQAHGFSLSQPLPLLFVDIKRRFLETLEPAENYPDWHLSYPLADQFGSTSYTPMEFVSFLQSMDLTSNYLTPLLQRMQNYSGQYYKPDAPFKVFDHWISGSLISFIEAYASVNKAALDAVNIYWKETFCEEFIPYLLSQGTDVKLIIRDPRDSIASQISGNYTPHAGLRRPLLFLVRQWRKSVAYALEFKKHEGFEILTYEDVVSEAIQKPSELNLSNDPKMQSNSSFDKYDTISSNSIGSYKKNLSSEHRRFIESCCYHEMKVLGYTPGIELEDCLYILKSGFEQDFTKRELLSDFRYTDERREEEVKRYDSLVEPSAVFDPQMHIFETLFNTLRDASYS